MNDEQERFLIDLFVTQLIPLIRFANAKIGNIHCAEEIVQDTFLIAQRKIDAVMECENPIGWLFNAANNLIKHERRRRKQAITLYFELERGTDATDFIFIDDYIFEVADMFSDAEWQLLRMACIERFPIGAIADTLGISYEACKKRIRKIKATARERFDDERI